MPGVVVFHSMVEAFRAGFAVYDRSEHGYLVRKRTSSGWAMAVVDLKLSPCSQRG